jgi:hypothetical protein
VRTAQDAVLAGSDVLSLSVCRPTRFDMFLGFLTLIILIICKHQHLPIETPSGWWTLGIRSEMSATHKISSEPCVDKPERIRPPQQSTSKIPTLCKPSHSATSTVENTSQAHYAFQSCFVKVLFIVPNPLTMPQSGLWDPTMEGQVLVNYLSQHVIDCHLSSKPNTTHYPLTITSS